MGIFPHLNAAIQHRGGGGRVVVWWWWGGRRGLQNRNQVIKMRVWRGIFGCGAEAPAPFLHTVIAKLPAICSAPRHKLPARRKRRSGCALSSLPTPRNPRHDELWGVFPGRRRCGTPRWESHHLPRGSSGGEGFGGDSRPESPRTQRSAPTPGRRARP